MVLWMVLWLVCVIQALNGKRYKLPIVGDIAEKVHNRMPVILDPCDYDRWMEPGDPSRPPIDLLRPYAAEKMRAWPVHSRVGNVRNNDPQLLEECPPDAPEAMNETLQLPFLPE